MNVFRARWLRLFLSLCVLLAIVLHGSTATAQSGGGKGNTYKKSVIITYSDWEFPDTLNIFQTGLGVTLLTMNSVLASPLIFDDKAHLQPDLLVNVPSVKNGEILNKGRTII